MPFGIGTGIGLGMSAAHAFSPADLSGLWLWLRGDAGVTVVSSHVSTWADQSGNGRDFSQGTSADRPTQGTVNGLSTVLYSGTGGSGGGAQFLSRGSFSGPASAAHAFLVVKAATDTGGEIAGIWDFGSSASAAWYTFSGDIYEDFGSTTRQTIGNPTPSLAVANIYEVESASGNFTVRLNGTSLFTSGTNTVGWAGTALLGKNSDGAGLTGDQCELVIYDNIKSSSDAALVRANLKARWGTP